MKLISNILTAIILMAGFCLAWNSQEEFTMYTCLSQQIKTSDIAGTGTVTTNNSSSFQVLVENYWYGASTNNLVTLILDDELEDQEVPGIGSNIVFFATAHLTNAYSLLMSPDVMRFDYPPVTTNAAIDADIFYLPGNSRAYFLSDAENGTLIQYASNLVNTLRLDKNLDDYYDLIRTNAINSHYSVLSAHENRCSSQAISALHDGSNMLLKIAADTNSIPFLQNIARGRLRDEFGITNFLENVSP